MRTARVAPPQLARDEPSRDDWPRARRPGAGPSVLAEGAIAGLVGAAAVALWFFIHDLVIGAPLRTPAMLGAFLFKGVRSPEGVVVTVPLVLAFTAVHVGAFLVFGWIISALFRLADREPRFYYALFVLFCSYQVVVFAMIAIVATYMLYPLAWWLIAGANLAATAAMLWAMSWRHRIAIWRSDVMPTGSQ